MEQKAYFYVCGDAAHMAREVNAVLGQILAENRGITEQKAEEIVKNMRAANQYQVSPQRPPSHSDPYVSTLLTQVYRRTFGHRECLGNQEVIKTQDGLRRDR